MSLEALATAARDIEYWKEEELPRASFPGDIGMQLRDNLIPILEAIVAATGGELAAHAEAITSLIDEEEIIHPELSARIVGTLALGRFICKMLRDENVLPDHEKLQEAIKVYLQRAPEVESKVAEITAMPEELDDDEDTPVETPRKPHNENDEKKEDEGEEGQSETESAYENSPPDGFIEEALDDFIEEEEIA